MKLIVAYQSEWISQFQQIQSILQQQLGKQISGIEHVGSTSVPDLAAKAIIDIDIVYENASFFPLICEGLAMLGYFHNGNQGIPKREAFKRKKEAIQYPILDKIPHHLYACPKDSPELKRHLLFRDFLRKHKWARNEYVSIKMEIAAQTHQDKAAYSLLKESVATPFIEKVLLFAKDEFSI